MCITHFDHVRPPFQLLHVHSASSSQILWPFLLTYVIILSPISVACMHAGVGLTSGAWATYQVARPWRKPTLLPSAPFKLPGTGDSSTRDEAV